MCHNSVCVCADIFSPIKLNKSGVSRSIPYTRLYFDGKSIGGADTSNDCVYKKCVHVYRLRFSSKILRRRRKKPSSWTTIRIFDFYFTFSFLFPLISFLFARPLHLSCAFHFQSKPFICLFTYVCVCVLCLCVLI